MAHYHIAADKDGIYVGTTNTEGNIWLDKTEVTDEAIEAVRDYMVENLLGGFDHLERSTSGLVWELDGVGEIVLRISALSEKRESHA